MEQDGSRRGAPVPGPAQGGRGEAAPAAATSGPGGAAPVERLLWGGYFRLIMAVFWLGVAFAITPGLVWMWGPLVAYAVLAAAAVVLLRSGRASRVSAVVLPLMDVALISLPVYAFGSRSSPLPVLYLAPIMAFVVTRGRRLGLAVLLLSICSYLAVLLLEAAGVLPPAPLAPVEPPGSPELDAIGFVRSFVVMAVSMVGAYAFLSVTVARIERHAATERRLLQSERAAQGQSQELRARLEEAERLESLGRLAGGVAHDFNNLLTGILGYARLARDEVGAASPARPDIDEVLRAAQRASELTSELLAFSRKQVVRLRPLDLNDLLVRVERMLIRVIGEDVPLRFARGPDLRPVRADPSQLERVVLNLVVNARDALSPGGSVSIETANVTVGPEGGEGRPDRVPPGDHVVLRVADDGVGMSEAILGRIFEPFFTTKEGGRGTGLGLASVYGIVRQHGGFLHVWSRPGAGSTFEVFLPVSGESPTGPEAEAAVDRVAGGDETVLVVEDEMLLRRLTSRILGHAGYRVLTASGGEQALDLIGRHEGEVDLLLTDVVMPGMTGDAVAVAVREARPTVRVVFMSGYADDVVRPEEALPSHQGFIQKPFTAAQLLGKVRRALDSAPSEPGPADDVHLEGRGVR